MAYSNPKFVNEAGGINLMVDDDENKAIYVEPGNDLHDQALNGDFGTVSPFEPEGVSAPLREALRADFRGALLNLGHLAAVQAAVTATGGLVEIMWDDATSFMENDPTLTAMAAQLSIDVAAVFDEAENVKAARASSLVA